MDPFRDVGLFISQALGVWAQPPLSAITVLLISIGLTLLHFGVQRMMIDVKELSEQYREVAEWRRELIKARRSGDKKALSKLLKKEAYIKKLNAEIMAKSMKPMLIYLIPFWLLFMILFNAFLQSVAFFPLLDRGLPFIYWYLIANGSTIPIFQRLLGLSYTSTD